jgi:low temperature requirement protein LtrA
MAATFFMALAVPDAYGEDGAWFGSAFFALLVLNVVLYLRGTRRDRELQRSVARLAAFFLVGPTLTLAGGLVDGEWRTGLWLAGFAVNLAGALDAGRSTWRVSPAHFAERHALFVIIALGESIVAIGVGALEAERGLMLAGAILAALAGTFALWWAYFDFAASAIERGLRRATDPVSRGRAARDVFTFLHFPMVAGIVLFAVAAKKAVAHGDEPLGAAGRFALGAGLALVLLAFAIGRFRLIRSIAWERIGAAAGIALAVWLGVEVAASGLIAIAVGVLAAALAVEAYRLREFRRRIRAG